MNRLLQNKEQKLKRKIPITVLSVISLICTAFGYVTYFIDSYDYTSILTTRFPSLNEIIPIIISLAISILFILYMLKFYKNRKAKFIFPICLVAMAINNVINTVKINIYYSNTTMFDRKNVTMLLVRNNIFTVIFVGAVILAVIGLFKGFTTKPFITAVAVTRLVDVSLSSLSVFLLYIRGVVNSGFSDILLLLDFISDIGYIMFFAALLLFALTNDIPGFANKTVENEVMNTEQELRLLNDKYNSGIITEKEYADMRAEIISRL